MTHVGVVGLRCSVRFVTFKVTFKAVGEEAAQHCLELLCVSSFMFVVMSYNPAANTHILGMECSCTFPYPDHKPAVLVPFQQPGNP